MRRRLFYRRPIIEDDSPFNQTDNINPSKAEALDVVFANKNTEELRIARKWNTDIFPISAWEPIGLVVIPGQHGVLKDGSGRVSQCGVMSLVPMDYTTPETGGVDKTAICWGNHRYDISGQSDGLRRYDSVTDGFKNILINQQYVVKQSEVGDVATSSNSTAKTPYKHDNKNSGRYNEDYSASTAFGNPFAEFRGIVNTKILTDLSVNQQDWRTASTIVNAYDSGCYPAACCCARFHTLGTKAFIDCTNEELRNGTRFWYMPAMGELGYIMPRWADINDTISKLQEVYGSDEKTIGAPLVSTDYYWSSTEYAMTDSFYLRANNGYVDDLFKYFEGSVRAFMRLQIEQPLLTAEFILDQTISDPAQKLTGPLGKDGTPETNIISWIRANSHRYVGSYGSEGMTLKQLDDDDSTKYADGTNASSDLTSKDVFMRMPTFWVKGTMLEDNKCKIQWTNKEPAEGSWVKWDDNTLIGVYKASAGNTSNNSQGWLYSRSGYKPTASISHDNFKAKARNRSQGEDHFMLVTYETHKVMALLYACYYGNLDSQVVIGTGAATETTLSGQTNTLGMRDTINETSGSINFWGLENWWGQVLEDMDNLLTTWYTVKVLDYDGNIIKEIRGHTKDTGEIQEMVLGEELELLPKTVITNTNYDTYYCDYGAVQGSDNYAAARSISGGSRSGGVFYLNITTKTSATYPAELYYYLRGTRLQYNGRVIHR